MFLRICLAGFGSPVSFFPLSYWAPGAEGRSIFVWGPAALLRPFFGTRRPEPVKLPLSHLFPAQFLGTGENYQEE